MYNLTFYRNRFERAMMYNGTDVVATLLLKEAMEKEHDPFSEFIYKFQMALHAPFLACGLRGLRFDEEKAAKLLHELQHECDVIKRWAHRLAKRIHPAWDFSISSSEQVKELLYGTPTVFPCPDCGWTGRVITRPAETIELGVYKSGPRKGQPKLKVYKERSRACSTKHVYPGLSIAPYLHHKTKEITADKIALEKIMIREPEGSLAHQIAKLRFEFMKRQKLMGFLRAPRNPQGYYPFVINTAATKSLRASSSSNAIGEGSNGQNIDKRAEKLLIPDEGYSIREPDLARAESHMLAVMAGDRAYIEAHEGPYDTHTFVATLAFKDYPWTGDPKADKQLAESTYMFGKSLRDSSKIVQHAIGRIGTPYTVARTLRISLEEAEAVFAAVCSAIPDTIAWMEDFKRRLWHDSVIYVDVGPARWKFPVTGDPRDDKTARDMISAVLQSPVWYVCCQGMLNCWYEFDHHEPRRGVGPFELLRQKHDSIMYQCYTHLLPEYEPAVKDNMRIPLFINGRDLTLGVD